jgi:two-component system NarL family sensor kinase
MAVLAVAGATPLAVAFVRLQLEEQVSSGLLLAAAAMGGASLARTMLLARAATRHAVRAEELEQIASRLLGAADEAGDRERATIASDLHDGAVQTLTALALELDLCQLSAAGGRAVPPERIQAAAARAQAATRELRAVMAGLWPPSFGEGASIEVAVGDLVGRLAKEHQLDVEVDVVDLPELPPATAMVLYRIVQEATANIGRHAEASTVRVRLAAESDVVRLTITDDGRGFDLASDGQRTAGGHYGVAGMRRRALVAGGRLDIDSAPGRGTTLALTLPVDPPVAAPVDFAPDRAVAEAPVVYGRWSSSSVAAAS